MRRRELLKLALAGSVGVSLIGAARAARVGLFDRRPDEAWTDLAREHGVRALAAAGILAANPHNSQPWSFGIGDQRLDVHVDPRRALGPVDPFLRQMLLGIGCAIENIVVAATTQGLFATTALLPDPDEPTLAASIALSQSGVAVDSHAAALSRRHTNRGPYHRDRPIDAQVMRSLEQQAAGSSAVLALFDASSARGRVFSDVVLAATAALIDDAVFMTATDAWFRWTRRDVREHRDGPALDCAGLVPATLIAAQLAPRPSASRYHDSWLAATRDIHLATAPTYGIIAVPDAARPEELLDAGRLWQRLHLEATLHDVALQPLDQWLELVDRARQRGISLMTHSAAQLAPPGFSPVMMFRAGRAVRPALPSARRHLEDVLLSPPYTGRP